MIRSRHTCADVIWAAVAAGEGFMSVETPSGAPSFDRDRKLVLIVEDNDLNMKLFHDLLEAHGYDVVGAREGADALSIARSRRPNLILMDIQLPEVSGLDVIKWLKSDDELRSIPIIAVTAFAMKGDEEKIRRAGCEDYVSKPIAVAKFVETVKRFLS